VGDLRTVVRDAAAMAGPRTPFGALRALVGHRLGRMVTAAELDAALIELDREGVLAYDHVGPTPTIRKIGASRANARTNGASSPAQAPALPSEQELMPALGRYLHERFVPDLAPKSRGETGAVVVDTSRRPGAGIWSRPDFTVAALRRQTYATARAIDLYGFELKRARRGNVIAVHEAVAHTRYVHYAYLVVHQPAGTDPADASHGEAECRRLGIGLIRFDQPGELDGWQRDIDPLRQPPDADEVDAYIDRMFTASERDSLLGWLETG